MGTRVSSLLGFGPGEVPLDGSLIPVEDVFILDANRHENGEDTRREMHLGLVDGTLHWFADCGDPLGE
ncbi:MAG: hypothetical protein JW785_00460 [Acidimicrobiia bacterium]|nr:hypothetical protein [Acidimicrobiia bacterium]